MNKLALLTVSALVVGIASGLVARAYGLPPGVETGLTWISSAWTEAFAMVAIPLVMSQLFLAIGGSAPPKHAVRRFGLAVPGVFTGLLVIAAAISVALTLLGTTLPIFQALTLPAVTGAAVDAPAGGAAAGADAAGSFLDAFLPGAILQAALQGELLALMCVALVVALIARRISGPRRQVMLDLASSVSELSFVAAHWLLNVAPPIVFAVGLLIALGSGVRIGSVLLAFVVLHNLVYLAVALAQYPLAALGGVSMAKFARAVAPAQMVALTTRSSLATIPALVTGAERGLGLPTDVSVGTLGLGGALLKLSRATTGPVKLIVIAHLIDMSLSATQVLTFIVTVILISPSTPGIPKMSSGARSMPAYLAAGLPAEYVLLVGSTAALTDMFATMVNATGYLSSTVLVNRLVRGRARAATEQTAT